MIHIVASHDENYFSLEEILASRVGIAGIRKPPPIADEPKRQEGSVEWILNRALALVGEMVAGK